MYLESAGKMPICFQYQILKSISKVDIALYLRHVFVLFISLLYSNSCTLYDSWFECIEQHMSVSSRAANCMQNMSLLCAAMRIRIFFFVTRPQYRPKDTCIQCNFMFCILCKVHTQMYWFVHVLKCTDVIVFWIFLILCFRLNHVLMLFLLIKSKTCAPQWHWSHFYIQGH